MNTSGFGYDRSGAAKQFGSSTDQYRLAVIVLIQGFPLQSLLQLRELRRPQWLEKRIKRETPMTLGCRAFWLEFRVRLAWRLGYDLPARGSIPRYWVRCNELVNLL